MWMLLAMLGLVATSSIIPSSNEAEAQGVGDGPIEDEPLEEEALGLELAPAELADEETASSAIEGSLVDLLPEPGEELDQRGETESLLEDPGLTYTDPWLEGEVDDAFESSDLGAGDETATTGDETGSDEEVTAEDDADAEDAIAKEGSEAPPVSDTDELPQLAGMPGFVDEPFTEDEEEAWRDPWLEGWEEDEFVSSDLPTTPGLQPA